MYRKFEERGRLQKDVRCYGCQEEIAETDHRDMQPDGTIDFRRLHQHGPHDNLDKARCVLSSCDVHLQLGRFILSSPLRHREVDRHDDASHKQKPYSPGQHLLLLQRVIPALIEALTCRTTW